MAFVRIGGFQMIAQPFSTLGWRNVASAGFNLRGFDSPQLASLYLIQLGIDRGTSTLRCVSVSDYCFVLNPQISLESRLLWSLP